MAPGRMRVPPVIVVLVLASVVIEVVIVLLGYLSGSVDAVRAYAVDLFGFRVGFLPDARPAYPGQSAFVFISYSLLHVGFAHLVANMLTLLALGGTIVNRIGTYDFLLLYALSSVAGAICYALLSAPGVPVVGASGALFGLAGALVAWEFLDARHDKRSAKSAFRFLLLLIALNVVLWWASGGRLAWQAHLGGAIAGLVFVLMQPRMHPS